MPKKTNKAIEKVQKKTKKIEQWAYINLEKLEQKIETKYKERPLNIDEDISESRVSTGSLCLDLITGGGIPSGRWVSFFGAESSGKSTAMYLMMKALTQANVPKKDAFDYESSLATQYFANIMGKPLEVVLGKRNDDDTEWVNKPLIRHYMPDYGEKAFYIIADKLDSMPDVITIKGKRYLRFTTKQVKDYKIPKEQIVFQKDNYAFLNDDGPPIKYAIFIDSFPEMTPEALMKDPTKNPMAQFARMFSECIPLIRPRLKMKGATVIGVNHLRMKPMQLFGNPEYSPCGEHIKHATDIRYRVSSVGIPGGKGKIEEEVNLDGKVERYAYTKFKTDKNKTFPKYKECILRVCIEVEGESGYGIDPVYDTLTYLASTKQVTKRGDKIVILMEGGWSDIHLTWDDFRKLILRPTDTKLITKLLANKSFKEYITNIKSKKELKNKQAKERNAKELINKITKFLDIRSACFKQLQSGVSFKMAAKKAKEDKQEENEKGNEE